jgi:hypothetical protein
LIPGRDDELDSVLPRELGQTLWVAVERGHEHFHRDPFFSCAAVHHNRRCHIHHSNRYAGLGLLD